MTDLVLGEDSYHIIDTIEKITVADSFVRPKNKIGTGNGEAKLYVGNDNTETRNFFGAKGFTIKCIMLKKDLLKYLDDAREEYESPEQPYRNADLLPQLWRDRYNSILDLEDTIEFEIHEQTQISGPRVYVNSSERPYKLIRELSLPNITYLSSIKLEKEGQNYFYFRLFVDYFGDSKHPEKIRLALESIEDTEYVSDSEKVELKTSRIGQGKYRKELLEECPFCPITLVSDDRILIASHIKPWVDSDVDEKTDPKNGFMFTPTFDLLFDRGFISFSNDKEMLVSPWLSKMTCSKLNITPLKKYSHLHVDGREKYLKYHRENIFKS